MVSALMFYKCTLGRWLYLHQFGVKSSFAERLLKYKSNFNSFMLLLTITVIVINKLTLGWMLVIVLPARHPIPWNTEWWKDSRCLCGGSSYSDIGQKNGKTLKRIIFFFKKYVNSLTVFRSVRCFDQISSGIYDKNILNELKQRFLEINKKLMMLVLFYRSKNIISIILPRNKRKIKYEIHFSMSCVFVDLENDKRLIMNRVMVNDPLQAR